MVADEELGAVRRGTGVGGRGPCGGGCGFGLARCDVGEEGVSELRAGRVAGEHVGSGSWKTRLNNKREAVEGILAGD